MKPFEYSLTLVAALLVCMAAGALRLQSRQRRGIVALPALVLSAVLGFALAKVGYVLMQWNFVGRRYGVQAFLRMDPTEFCFFMGCAGVALGMLLAAVICRRPVLRTMDAFAPGLALGVAVARMGEIFLDVAGTGAYVQNEALQFFPVAVVNEWQEWYYAVFMLSGVCALAVAAVWFFRRGDEARPGLTFLRVAFYLALPQLFCESLRVEFMRWGFVKVEQLLCAVTAVGVIALHCKAGRRWWPLAATLGIVAGLVGVEFALDKSGLPALPCYSVMLLLLAALAAVEILALRRPRTKATV